MAAAVMPVRAVTLLGLLAVALVCAGLPLQLFDAAHVSGSARR